MKFKLVSSFFVILLIITSSSFIFAEETHQGQSIFQWKVCGPFSYSTELRYWHSNFEHPYLGDYDANFQANPLITFESNSSQVAIGNSSTSGVDLKPLFDTGTSMVVAYAYSEITSEEKREVRMGIGSTGPIRVWLNGKQVWDYIDSRDFKPEEDKVPVHLLQGKNSILVKSYHRAGDWLFNVSILPQMTFSEQFKRWSPFLGIILLIAIIGMILERNKTTDFTPGSGRLMSLDALRGFDMFWITGGEGVIAAIASLAGNYTVLQQLEHRNWNGFNFEDLIFPLFLFIVGVAVPFAFTSRMGKGATRKQLVRHIIQRAIILFVLGIIYSGGFNRPSFHQMRFLGVLQRIAICYFFASMFFLFLSLKTQIGVFISILAGYFLFMKFVPVPGIGAGLLIPDYNWANYLDLHFLPGSLYQGTWDNEGYLSTIPAIATAMMGIFTGYWLKSKNSPQEKTFGLLIYGVISIVLALIWDRWFPINKLLWSSSYVLFAGGWSLIVLSLFYWVIDVKGYHKWAFPFIVIGVNAIAIYFFGSFINFLGLAKRFVGGMWVTAVGAYGPLLIATATYLATWLLLYWLYKKKIFIKL